MEGVFDFIFLFLFLSFSTSCSVLIDIIRSSKAFLLSLSSFSFSSFTVAKLFFFYIFFLFPLSFFPLISNPFKTTFNCSVFLSLLHFHFSLYFLAYERHFSLFQCFFSWISVLHIYLFALKKFLNFYENYYSIYFSIYSFISFSFCFYLLFDIRYFCIHFPCFFFFVLFH